MGGAGAATRLETRRALCPQVVSVAVCFLHAQALPAMGWPWEGSHSQGCVEQGAKGGRQRSLPAALGVSPCPCRF